MRRNQFPWKLAPWRRMISAKMPANKKRTSILSRLVILFSVVVIPIIVVGIYIQMQITRQLQDNILASISEKVTDSIQVIDDTFNQTIENTFDVLTSNRVQRLANPNDPMSTYDRSTNVNYVRNLLDNLKYSNPYLSNIHLYLPELSVYYNVGYLSDYENLEYLDKKSQGEMSQETYQELLSLQNASAKVQIHNGNMVFLQYSVGHEPNIIVEAIYAPPSLKSMFSQTLLYESSLYLFTLEEYNFTVTNCSKEILDQLSGSYEEPVTKLRINEETWYAFSTVSQTTDSIYTQFVPADELFISLEMSTTYSIIFTVTVLLFSAVFIFGAFRTVHGPIQDLSVGLRQIEDSNFDVQLEMPAILDFEYLYERFNKMSAHLNRLIKQELQNEILLNKAQLKQLQAQINPHFLYNSFFILNQMIEREMYEEARELSGDLGSYFRYITRNYSDEVSLEDEYNHTKIYADIQLKRFSRKIQIQMEELPEDFRGLPVPKLILQPLFENAFNYGLEKKIRGGLLKLSFRLETEAIVIIIEDNGEQLSDETLASMQDGLRQLADGSFDREATGLFNICKRLQLYYERKDVVQVSRSSLGGLQVAVKLFEI